MKSFFLIQKTCWNVEPGSLAGRMCKQASKHESELSSVFVSLYYASLAGLFLFCGTVNGTCGRGGYTLFLKAAEFFPTSIDSPTELQLSHCL